MKIPKTVELHFNTAKSLICGVEESMKELEKLPADTWKFPAEHSPESIKRRLIQARQELLTVEKKFQNLWSWK